MDTPASYKSSSTVESTIFLLINDKVPSVYDCSSPDKKPALRSVYLRSCPGIGDSVMGLSAASRGGYVLRWALSWPGNHHDRSSRSYP